MIIIGVQTQREEVAVDLVSELRLLTQGLIDELQYEAIISERVYPRLRELRVGFYPSVADAQRGLVVIDVPLPARRAPL